MCGFYHSTLILVVFLQTVFSLSFEKREANQKPASTLSWREGRRVWSLNFSHKRAEPRNCKSTGKFTRKPLKSMVDPSYAEESRKDSRRSSLESQSLVWESSMCPEVKDSCASPRGGRESTLDPLEEQPVIFTVSPAPWCYFLAYWFFCNNNKEESLSL